MIEIPQADTFPDDLTPEAIRWAALIEAGIFLVSGLPGLRRPPFAGLQFRSFPGRHPLANIVGAARLASAEAAATVVRVRDYFGARGQPFSWRVGPASDPPDLARHLIAAGLRPAFTMRGMVMPQIAAPVVAPGPFVVRDAGPDDVAALAALIEQSYPTSSDLAYRLSTLYLHPAASGTVRVVVACAPDRAGLAGMGVCYDFPDCPVTVLAGAGTAPALRNRGVYRQLLAYRLHAARQRGVTSAVTQAVTDTSAPICRRSGFVDLCELQVFEFHPGRCVGDDAR
jgi:N-acetylglutamate synthase-like GNAT family acetyltransferase